jgi:putative phosphoesterase
VLDAFEGVDLVVHAGDVGDEAVLTALEEVAPVVAVRGNMDRSGSTADLPGLRAVRVEDVTVVVSHEHGDARGAAEKEDGPVVVVFGHTHRRHLRAAPGPASGDDAHDGVVLELNPGAVQRARDHSVALLRVDGREVEARFVEV